jgi:methylmalonyl-CoA mutase N-terminal domain/subunit
LRRKIVLAAVLHDASLSRADCGSTLTAQQPDNNIVRVALQALAAVLGGAQSLHTNSKDEALALPAADAARLALRTQQIIAWESGITNTVAPVGGAEAIERITDTIERQPSNTGYDRSPWAACSRRSGGLGEPDPGIRLEYQLHRDRERVIVKSISSRPMKRDHPASLQNWARKGSGRQPSVICARRDGRAVAESLRQLETISRTEEFFANITCGAAAVERSPMSFAECRRVSGSSRGANAIFLKFEISNAFHHE